MVYAEERRTRGGEIMNNYILTFTGEIKVHIRANSEFGAVRGAKQELVVEQNILRTDNLALWIKDMTVAKAEEV